MFLNSFNKRLQGNRTQRLLFLITILGVLLICLYALTIRSTSKPPKIEFSDTSDVLNPVINLVCENDCKEVTKSQVEWIVNCQKINKNSRLQLWNSKNIVEVIYKRERMGVKAVLNDLPAPQKHYLTKMLVAYHFGGIVMDHDNKCLRPFPKELTIQSESFTILQLDKKESTVLRESLKWPTKSHSEHLISTKFIGAQPGHPLTRSIIDSILDQESTAKSDTLFNEALNFTDAKEAYTTKFPATKDVIKTRLFQSIFSFASGEALRWCQSHKHEYCQEILSAKEESASEAVLANVRDIPGKEVHDEAILTTEELRKMLKDNDISYETYIQL